jgi:Flp pilus assembly protein TadD
VRPEVAYLLDSAYTAPGLERVFATRRRPAVLYRIEPEFGRGAVGPEELTREAIQRARVLVTVLSDSSVAPYHALLAADALDHGRVEEAIEHAGAAIRWQPRGPEWWTLMGDAQRAGGHPEDAALAYGDALALDPGESRARLGLGWVQLAQGQRELAARTWRPLAGAVDDPATARTMADLFSSLGDAAAASAVLHAGPQPPKSPGTRP